MRADGHIQGWHCSAPRPLAGVGPERAEHKIMPWEIQLTSKMMTAIGAREGAAKS